MFRALLLAAIVLLLRPLSVSAASCKVTLYIVSPSCDFDEQAGEEYVVTRTYDNVKFGDKIDTEARCLYEDQNAFLDEQKVSTDLYLDCFDREPAVRAVCVLIQGRENLITADPHDCYCTGDQCQYTESPKGRDIISAKFVCDDTPCAALSPSGVFGIIMSVSVFAIAGLVFLHRSGKFNSASALLCTFLIRERDERPCGDCSLLCGYFSAGALDLMSALMMIVVFADPRDTVFVVDPVLLYLTAGLMFGFSIECFIAACARSKSLMWLFYFWQLFLIYWWMLMAVVAASMPTGTCHQVMRNHPSARIDLDECKDSVVSTTLNGVIIFYVLLRFVLAILVLGYIRELQYEERKTLDALRREQELEARLESREVSRLTTGGGGAYETTPSSTLGRSSTLPETHEMTTMPPPRDTDGNFGVVAVSNPSVPHVMVLQQQGVAMPVPAAATIQLNGQTFQVVPIAAVQQPPAGAAAAAGPPSYHHQAPIHEHGETG